MLDTFHVVLLNCQTVVYICPRSHHKNLSRSLRNLLDVFENYSKMPTSQIGVIIGSTNRLEISIKNGSAANIVAPISIKVRVL